VSTSREFHRKKFFGKERTEDGTDKTETECLQTGLENIIIFSKILKYRKYQKYHDIFVIYFTYITSSSSS